MKYQFEVADISVIEFFYYDFIYISILAPSIGYGYNPQWI